MAASQSHRLQNATGKSPETVGPQSKPAGKGEFHLAPNFSSVEGEGVGS
jgi:hypothetical protein